MQVKLTQSAEGYKAGAVVTVSNERGEWYIRNGYATRLKHSDPFAPTAGSNLPVAPSKAAKKEDWVAFAVANGLSRDQAESMTKTALVEAYA